MPKKRGRKKKRGPKKKKPVVVHKYVGLKRPYHIITSNNGMQIKDIYSGVNIEYALNKLKELQKEYNKDIVFPVRFISNKKEKTFIECDYKLILIKKRTDEPNEYEGKVKNEFGKYVDCVTDSEHWIFIDELPYQIEETFWVYGYNPKRQRKTFNFIFDNLIQYSEKNKYYFKELVVFKNKLLINSNDEFNMIICKNHKDSVRLYNKIHEVADNKKIKYLVYGGDIQKSSYSFHIWYNKIKSLTNWNNRKIMKNTTRD
jgi:hypothetical protein